jgi:hypothetical protein
MYTATETWADFFGTTAFTRESGYEVWNFMCQDLRSLQTEKKKELTNLNLAVLQVSCDKDATEPTEDWPYTFFCGKPN